MHPFGTEASGASYGVYSLALAVSERNKGNEADSVFTFELARFRV